MPEPQAGVLYLVELCSGEERRWRCLGPDARTQNWWRDVESGLEFSEASLMYAWKIIGRQDD